MMNMSAFGLHEFVEMQYFGDYMPSTIVSSIVLITTDSLFSVFAVAYFLSGPGVWLGVAIQRWLGNGEEPNDPEERGQRMGQFLGKEKIGATKITKSRSCRNLAIFVAFSSRQSKKISQKDYLPN